MDHQAKVWQVKAACRHIGRNTDPRSTIAQGLQSIGPLPLGELARKGDHVKAALSQAGIKPPYRFAR